VARSTESCCISDSSTGCLSGHDSMSRPNTSAGCDTAHSDRTASRSVDDRAYTDRQTHTHTHTWSNTSAGCDTAHSDRTASRSVDDRAYTDRHTHTHTHGQTCQQDVTQHTGTEQHLGLLMTEPTQTDTHEQVIIIITTSHSRTIVA